MEEDKTDIMTRINALRSEAGKKLEGNAYFQVALQLDAVLADQAALGPDAEAALQHIAATFNKTDIVARINALRTEAGSKLEGNVYFQAALQLDAVLADGADADAALQRIAGLINAAEATPDQPSSPATDTIGAESKPETEQEAVKIALPKANSFGSPQPTIAVNYSTMNTDAVAEADASELQTETPSQQPQEMDAAFDATAAEPEEKTGFDELNEVSWQRVQEVTSRDESVAALINGEAPDNTDFSTAETVAAPVQEVSSEPVNTETVSAAAIAPESEAEPEVAEEPEISMEQSRSAFTIVLRPTIINRPVQQSGAIKPKRVAKLAHLPVQRS